jgi:hypothetical protein
MLDTIVGGRMYAPINLDRRTVLLDHYLQRIISASGVDKLLPEQGELNDEYLRRLHGHLLSSGKACDLLGGYLLPSGITERTWTEEVAADTAQHLGKCDTAVDRELVDMLIMECVLGFFQQRIASFMNFLNSSGNQAIPESQTAAH